MISRFLDYFQIEQLMWARPIPVAVMLAAFFIAPINCGLRAEARAPRGTFSGEAAGRIAPRRPARPCKASVLTSSKPSAD